MEGLIEAENKISVLNWMEMFGAESKPVSFQVYTLEDSYYIWVGSYPQVLKSMSLALQTKYVCFTSLNVSRSDV
jgi:hypothetical protein